MRGLGRVPSWPTVAAVAVGLAFVAPEARADVEVEYVAHACFVLTSPGGTRVVIDPYSPHRWLGYGFPDGVEADAVLVTHPHYDHDASYYWGDSVTVFREPGSYRLNDVEILGIRAKHADPYGEDFAQLNTVWRVEAGGVRLAHLGDNGPLTDEAVRALGTVDVVLLPADGDDHILKSEEIATIRRQLGDPLVVPMHYRLDGFRGLPRSLGPIDPWLENQAGVVRLEKHRARLTADRVPGRDVLVFSPSPDVEAWPDELATAWEKLGRARALADDPSRAAEAAALVEQAAATTDCIVFEFQWARVLVRTSRSDEAVAVLERALSGATHDDWEYRMRARNLLAGLYAERGRRGEAAAQHRIVLERSYRTELLDEARAFLGSAGAEPAALNDDGEVAGRAPAPRGPAR